MLTILWIAGLLLAVLSAIGFGQAAFIMGSGRRQTLEEARRWQEEHYDLAWYDALGKKDYTVCSFDGYILHAQYLKSPGEARRCVIISHGYTDNRFGALKYARIYLDRGDDVIVYDLRGHGMNARDFCTYSIREGRDLDALIRDARARFPGLEMLGIHGESLGAASSVACLKYAPPVDFVVSDCGFSEIRSVLENGMRRMHLLAAMVRLASACAKLRYGYGFDEMRPIDSLRDSRVPILFMHGTEDDLIPPAHSEAMYKAARELRAICLVPGAPHAESVLTDPALYREKVWAFLDKVEAADRS